MKALLYASGSASSRTMLALLLQYASGLPSPLVRAEAAAVGLRTHYFQTERGGAPRPPATHCPCFTCDSSLCAKEDCAFCGTRDACAGWGCYTSAARACDCNDPPPPKRPPGADTAASFFFACGQVGGSAAPDVPVLPSQCACVSDWPRACENCYRWWSAVSLEAMVNFAIAADLPSSSDDYQRTLSAAESMHLHAPYDAGWNATQHPTWIDDFAWYGLAYMRVHEWTGDDIWRRRAAALQDWGTTYGWDARQAADGSARLEPLAPPAPPPPLALPAFPLESPMGSGAAPPPSP